MTICLNFKEAFEMNDDETEWKAAFLHGCTVRAKYRSGGFWRGKPGVPADLGLLQNGLCPSLHQVRNASEKQPEQYRMELQSAGRICPMLSGWIGCFIIKTPDPFGNPVFCRFMNLCSGGMAAQRLPYRWRCL